LEKFKKLVEVKTEEILEKAYSGNIKWLENYIRQNSGKAEDAKDILQDSLLAAWISYRSGRFEGDQERFNSYVRKICIYKWIDHLKTNYNKNTSLGGDMSVYTDSEEQDKLFADLLEESNKLNSRFAQLGDKCKMVLKAFYYENKSLSEIAASTGDTKESLKTIKYRCILRLKKIFLQTV
jgi:RNA polymerase sigma factor (sigma-70 family)